MLLRFPFRGGLSCRFLPLCFQSLRLGPRSFFTCHRLLLCFAFGRCLPGGFLPSCFQSLCLDASSFFTCHRLLLCFTFRSGLSRRFLPLCFQVLRLGPCGFLALCFGARCLAFGFASRNFCLLGFPLLCLQPLCLGVCRFLACVRLQLRFAFRSGLSQCVLPFGLESCGFHTSRLLPDKCLLHRPALGFRSCRLLICRLLTRRFLLLLCELGRPPSFGLFPLDLDARGFLAFGLRAFGLEPTRFPAGSLGASRGQSCCLLLLGGQLDGALARGFRSRRFLTLSFLTLSFLTLSFLTLSFLTLSFLTLSFLTLSFLTPSFCALCLPALRFLQIVVNFRRVGPRGSGRHDLQRAARSFGRRARRRQRR